LELSVDPKEDVKADSCRCEKNPREKGGEKKVEKILPQNIWSEKSGSWPGKKNQTTVVIRMKTETED